MKLSEFIHPKGAAALRQLESIPGFLTLVKIFYALGYVKLFYGTNMASNIRPPETHLPELNIKNGLSDILGNACPKCGQSVVPSWQF